jgi:hypothetical protein
MDVMSAIVMKTNASAHPKGSDRKKNRDLL